MYAKTGEGFEGKTTAFRKDVFGLPPSYKDKKVIITKVWKNSRAYYGDVRDWTAMGILIDPETSSRETIRFNLGMVLTPRR